MSSGLSMANVNKIKQMAEKHEYNLAIDILDSQNLERSLNPQFLRSCAEIYENVGRHKEARQLYVKAHSMAPEGNKIIFSIMNFYLKLGYFDLAKRYFEEFESNDVTGGQQLKDAEYIIKKATGAEMGVLFDMLYPYYRDNLDEDWSFELFLVTYLMDKKEDYDIISSDYLATFKDGYYTQTIRDILAGSESAETYFYIYSKEEVPDKNPDEEEVRAFEKDVLKADYIRHNPDLQEAVITEMVDDGAGASKFFGGKRKNKSADSNDSGIELTEAEETSEVSEETPSETPTEDNGSSVESLVREKKQKNPTIKQLMERLTRKQQILRSLRIRLNPVRLQKQKMLNQIIKNQIRSRLIHSLELASLQVKKCRMYQMQVLQILILHL